MALEVTIMSTLPRSAGTSAGNTRFAYDTSGVEWHEFFTPGTFYRILNVDCARRSADMLVRFDAGSQCMYHRHAARTTTLVLEGELREWLWHQVEVSIRVRGPS